MHYIFDNEA